MKEKFKTLISDKVCKILFILTMSGILGQVISLTVIFPQLPPEMPLFYSLHWGNRQLAPTWNLFLIPFLTAIFLLINVILAFFIFTADLFWKRILSFTSFIIGLMTVYWLIKTITIFL